MPPVIDEIHVPLTTREFLVRLDESWLRLMGLVESLTPAQLTGLTDAAGWTAKDHLAHLASWERGMTWLLRKQPRYEGMGVSADIYLGYDIDALNEAIRQNTSQLPLETVLDDLQKTHRQLVDQLTATPEADLQQTYSWFQPSEPGVDNGEPVMRRVAGNTFVHYDEHIPWIAAIVSG